MTASIDPEIQSTIRTFPPLPAQRSDTAMALALRLAHAEHALQAFTLGQVDAIVDPYGKTHLLRPAQEHLRQKEKRLQSIIDSNADVITVINRSGAIVSQSQAAVRVLGQEPDEVVGSRFFELIHEDDLPAVHTAFFNVMEEFYGNSMAQFRHLAGDGSYRMIEATVSKLDDPASDCVVFSMRPVTRLQWSTPTPVPEKIVIAETPLAQDRFLAMLSHELRTPLMPVLLGVFELQDDKRFFEARPTLAMIRRNVELQSRLLEELSDFTTLGQHKVRLQLESIDAHEHIRFVLEICQNEIDGAGIEVLLNLGALENVVLADSVRLQQVMWNLVKNAVKFSASGSNIAITSANEAPGTLTLQFADQGIGIEPELLTRLFDPFQQGDPQLYGGLGLGMFIAKGLAEAQNGTLTVASQGRGHGTTFRLTLKTAEGAGIERK